MGKTHFPNGISAQAASAANASAGAGDLDCDKLYAENGVIGEVISVPITFGTSSAAQVVGVPVPNFACNLVAAMVTVGSVSAVAAAYTVQGGSAGTVHVSGESNTITDSYAQEALTIDSAAISTAAGLQVTRGVQGTTGDTSLLLLFKRSA